MSCKTFDASQMRNYLHFLVHAVFPLPLHPLMSVSFICLPVNLFSCHTPGYPHAIIEDEVICFLSLSFKARRTPRPWWFGPRRDSGMAVSILIMLLRKERRPTTLRSCQVPLLCISTFLPIHITFCSLCGLFSLGVHFASLPVEMPLAVVMAGAQATSQSHLSSFWTSLPLNLTLEQPQPVSCHCYCGGRHLSGKAY